MAQTGYTPILIYSSSTVSQAPSAANLTNSTLGSELAINITDGKLFYKDNGGSVQVIGWKTVPTSAGGTGLTSYTAGDTVYYASGTALSKLAIGSSGYYMSSSGTAPQWSAPAALTKADDTNVTLTLGGSASTALLNAASITAGWTGLLSIARGGTNSNATPTAGGVGYGTGTAHAYSAAGTSGQALLSGGASSPTWGTLGTGAGGTGLTSFTANGVLYASSTSAISTGTGLSYDGTSFGVGWGSNPSAVGSALVVGNYSATSATAQSIYIATNKAYLSMTADGATNANGATISVGWANGGQGPLNLAIGATTTLQLAASGDVGFKTGNLVQGTAAKGINFTANTGAAGKTSQLLNWYEEGTWTPTANFSTSNTYTNAGRAGYYTRVGRMVSITGYFALDKSTATGTLTVTGLPFTSVNNAAGYTAVALGYVTRIGLASNVLNAVIFSNSSKIDLYFTPQLSTGVPTVATDSHIDTNTMYLVFNATYVAA